MLCETFLRSRAIGLAVGPQCNFPLSQSELGRVLGLSLVHTNRSLQAIRAEKLITLDGGVLTILDLDRLRALSASAFSHIP